MVKEIRIPIGLKREIESIVTNRKSFAQRFHKLCKPYRIVGKVPYDENYKQIWKGYQSKQYWEEVTIFERDWETVKPKKHKSVAFGIWWVSAFMYENGRILDRIEAAKKALRPYHKDESQRPGWDPFITFHTIANGITQAEVEKIAKSPAYDYMNWWEEYQSQYYGAENDRLS